MATRRSSRARDGRAVRSEGRQPRPRAWIRQARLAQPAVPEERRSGRSRARTSTGTCASNGYDLANGPGAGRRRGRAARPRADAEGNGRARGGVVPPLEHYDDAAVAKHLTAAARAPLADARERWRSCRRGRAEAVSRGAARNRRSARHRHGQGGAAAARGDHRHAGGPEFRTPSTWPGRAKPLRASTRRLQNCPAGPIRSPRTHGPHARLHRSAAPRPRRQAYVHAVERRARSAACG